MRHPLKFIVIGLPLLAFIVLAASAILLPQVVASRLAERADARHGMKLTVDGGSGFSISNGLVVVLNDVTLSQGSAQGVPMARIGRIEVTSPLSQVFSPTGLRAVRLVDPVFTFVAGDNGTSPTDGNAAVTKISSKSFAIEIENGTVKAVDPAHDLVIAATDISGMIARGEDGALEAKLRGLFNGAASELTLTVDDVLRLREKGSPADLALASAHGQIVMSGRLGLAGQVSFDGHTSAETKDARGFLAWLGMPLRGLAENTLLGVDAGLSISQSRASLTNLAFALGDMQAKGLVEVQAGTPRPRVKADLAFNLLTLNVYGTAQPGNPVVAAPDLRKDWREIPLPFDDLKAIDGEISITTDRFVAGAVDTGAAVLKATLDNGKLAARLDAAALFGGKGSLEFALNRGTTTAMNLSLDVTGVEAREFLGKGFGLTFLSGPVDLKADLTAKGESPAQLASTLAGTANVALQESRIDGLDLAALAGVISAADAQGWGLSPGSATALARATASANFTDGIATLKDTKLEAKNLTADVSGEIDLLRRAVDLKVSPGAGLRLPVAAKVKGPWDNPKLSAKIDIDNVLSDGVGNGAGNVAQDGLDDVAKGAAKKAKKALKKLFGN